MAHFPQQQQDRLRAVFGQIRTQFGKKLHSSAASIAQGHLARNLHHMKEAGWEQQFEQACMANFARWTRDNWEAVLGDLEHQVQGIQLEDIQSVAQLIQPRQLYHFPAVPLLPPDGYVPVLDTTRAATPGQPQQSTSLHHNLPPPPLQPLPLPYRGIPLQSAIQPSYATAPVYAGNHIVPHQRPVAPLSADDVSYHLDIWPLLTKIHTAFCNFIDEYHTREERPQLLEDFLVWDSQVRHCVKEQWQNWGAEYDGLARRQAKEILEGTLRTLGGNVFKGLPNIVDFILLPNLGEQQAQQEMLDPNYLSAYPSSSFHPSSSRPSSSHSGQHSFPSVQANSHNHSGWTMHDWAQHNNAHPSAMYDHNGQQLYPPPGHQQNMRELATWHRRMTERQARRYGTTRRAFAAEM